MNRLSITPFFILILLLLGIWFACMGIVPETEWVDYTDPSTTNTTSTPPSTSTISSTTTSSDPTSGTSETSSSSTLGTYTSDPIEFTTDPATSNFQNTTVDLTWQTNKPVYALVQYDVNPIAGGTFVNVNTDGVQTDFSFTLSGLTPGTLYDYRIIVYDGVSSQIESSIAQFSTTSTGDAIFVYTQCPEIIYDPATAETEITISWETNLPARYTLTYDTDTAFSTPQTDEAALYQTNHSVTLTGLDSGVVYFFLLESETAGGKSIDSDSCASIVGFQDSFVTYQNDLSYIGWVGEIYGGGAQTNWNADNYSTTGTEPSGFNAPVAVAYYNNHIYIAEESNDQIAIWTSSGTYADAPYTIGTRHPNGLCTDRNLGILYATWEHGIVCKYDISGDPTSLTAEGCIGDGNTTWTLPEPTSATENANDLYFYDPRGCAVNQTTGDILIADYSNHRIQKWQEDGTFVGYVVKGYPGGFTKNFNGGSGSNDGELNRPMDVAVDSTGNFYVAEYNNHRISKWDSSGIYQGWIGYSDNPDLEPHHVYTGWKCGGISVVGSNPGQFYNPRGISIDSNGHLYISDYSNHRIQKWTAEGYYVGFIGALTGNARYHEHFLPLEVARNESNADDIGFPAFYNPCASCFDDTGRFYIADYSNHRIMKF